MGAPLLLIDTANAYFRAYHAIPVTAVTAPDGAPVNAVRGFVDLLAAWIRKRRPGRLACALDVDWRPSWRTDLVPSYKSHRLGADGAELVPEALTGQVPVIMDILAAAGIVTVGAAGYEADDVIATLAAREPGPVEVITGDRDLFQVVDDGRRVTVLYPGRGASRIEIIDEEWIRQRYGVAANRYADLATLRGDPSDGLPGVAGIGAKTAARLIERYGGLDEVLAAIADPGSGLPAAVRTRLAGATEYLKAASRVVGVCRDVPVPGLDLALRSAPADPERLLALAERWRASQPVARLVDAMAGASPT